jgi:PAS domain S-box-containing protein
VQRDVTAARRAEAAARESDRHLRELVDALPMMISYVGADERYQLFNAAYERWFGRSAASLVGLSLRELLGEEAYAVRHDNIRAALSGAEQRFVAFTPRPDGSRRQTEVRYLPRRGENGAVAGFYVLVEDVTEQLQAEERLRESEARFRQLAGAIDQVFYVTDLTRGQLVYLSPSFERIWGIPGEVLMRDLSAFFESVHPDDRAALIAGKAAQERGEPTEREYRIVRPDGSIRQIRDRSFPVPGHVGMRAAGLAEDVTEQRRREAAAREQDHRLRLATRVARIGTWDLDLETGQGQWDDVALRVMGLEPAQSRYTAASWLNAVHPDDRERVRMAFAAALQPDGPPYEIECRGASPAADGGPRWIVSHGSVETDPQTGRARRALGIVRDITERRRSEERLRESEERFRVAADSSPALMWMCDADGQVMFANRQYRRFFGVDTDAMLGDGWRKIVHPEDVNSFHDAFRASFARREAFHRTVRVLHPELGVRWLNCDASPRHGANGAFLGYVGVNIDLTAAIVSADALRESEARFRTLANGVPNFVWFGKPNGEIEYLNDRWFDYTGQSPDAALPNGWVAALHPDDVQPTLRAWAEARERGRLYEVEMRYRRADGVFRWYVARAEPMRAADGGIVGWFGTSTDIHDRKEAEQTFERLVTHQSLLINELNHRVKNTLATVQAVAMQTFRDIESQDARRVFESRLIALAKAHDVLTRENWQGADLVAVVEEAIAPHRGIDPERFCVAGPSVRVTPRMALSLAMSLHELATNAVKYGALSSSSGHVRIEWGVSDSRRSVVLTWCEEGGPPVASPLHKGFGSRLIERQLTRELGGSARMDFAPSGLICRIEFPLPVEQEHEAKEGGR